MTDLEWFAANPARRIRIVEELRKYVIACRFGDNVVVRIDAVNPTPKMIFVARGEEIAEDYELLGDIEPSFVAVADWGKLIFDSFVDQLKEVP